jgi:hypothetical protein
MDTQAPTGRFKHAAETQTATLHIFRRTRQHSRRGKCASSPRLRTRAPRLPSCCSSSTPFSRHSYRLCRYQTRCEPCRKARVKCHRPHRSRQRSAKTRSRCQQHIRWAGVYPKKTPGVYSAQAECTHRPSLDLFIAPCRPCGQRRQKR